MLIGYHLINLFLFQQLILGINSLWGWAGQSNSASFGSLLDSAPTIYRVAEKVSP